MPDLRCPNLAGDLVGRLNLAFPAFGEWHAPGELLHQVFDSGAADGAVLFAEKNVHKYILL